MLYEDMIRIPLLIKAPNQTHSRRVSTLSEQIDLMPTILDMAGISVDTAAEGRSLVNAKGGPSSSKAIFTMNFEENPGFGNLQNGTVAMIEGDLKYTHYFGVCNYAMMPQLADSLYDLQSDPAETTNLITAKPDVSAKMLAIIQQQLNLHSEPQQ